MKPHGVIETGYLEILVSPIHRVRSITGVDECHVRRVREQTLIQSLIVGHGIHGLNPDPLVGRHRHRCMVSYRIDIAHFDGSRSLTIVLSCIGVVRNVFLEQGLLANTVLWARRIRHRELMAQTGFRLVERRCHAKYRLAALYRNDAARGETLAVSDSVDVIEYGDRRVSGTQKIAVQRVRQALWFGDGTGSGDERLANDLPAVHSLPALIWTPSSKKIAVDLLQIEKVQKVAKRLMHTCSLKTNALVGNDIGQPGQFQRIVSVLIGVALVRAVDSDLNVICLFGRKLRDGATKAFNHITRNFLIKRLG